jgi:hypothetical protein
LTNTLKHPSIQLSPQTTTIFWHLGGKLPFLPEDGQGRVVEFISPLTPTGNTRQTTHAHLDISSLSRIRSLTNNSQRNNRLQTEFPTTWSSINIAKTNIVDLVQPGNSHPSGTSLAGELAQIHQRALIQLDLSHSNRLLPLPCAPLIARLINTLTEAARRSKRLPVAIVLLATVFAKPSIVAKQKALNRLRPDRLTTVLHPTVSSSPRARTADNGCIET